MGKWQSWTHNTQCVTSNQTCWPGIQGDLGSSLSSTPTPGDFAQTPHPLWAVGFQHSVRGLGLRTYRDLYALASAPSNKTPPSTVQGAFLAVIFTPGARGHHCAHLHLSTCKARKCHQGSLSTPCKVGSGSGSHTRATSEIKHPREVLRCVPRYCGKGALPAGGHRPLLPPPGMDAEPASCLEDGLEGHSLTSWSMALGSDRQGRTGGQKRAVTKTTEQR